MTTDESIAFITEHDFSFQLEIDADGVTGDLQDSTNSLYVLECGKPRKLSVILKEMVAKVKELRRL